MTFRLLITYIQTCSSIVTWYRLGNLVTYKFQIIACNILVKIRNDTKTLYEMFWWEIGHTQFAVNVSYFQLIKLILVLTKVLYICLLFYTTNFIDPANYAISQLKLLWVIISECPSWIAANIILKKRLGFLLSNASSCVKPSIQSNSRSFLCPLLRQRQ